MEPAPASPDQSVSEAASTIGQIADHPWWIPVAGVVGFVLLGFAWALLPLDTWLEQLSRWIQSYGIVGLIAFGFLYAIGTLMLLPGMPLSIAAGAVFGWWALLLLFVAGLTSATVAFITGRYFARGYVLSIVRSRPVMRAAEEAINEEGWKIIALVRLSPAIPFGAQNYLFGATGVRLGTFLAVTAPAIVPSGLINVYIGLLGREAAHGNVTFASWTSLAIGIMATVVATLLIAKKARQKLAQHRTLH